jgi:hypothetical protein
MASEIFLRARAEFIVRKAELAFLFDPHYERLSAKRRDKSYDPH